MTEFWLNDKHIKTGLPPGLPLLDFIRHECGLTGTKTGCREGDCGACLSLSGRLEGDRVRYQSIVSCLTPLARAHGCHIVTVEGLGESLTPVQRALLDHSAIQCGFCTPGIVLALTALCLSAEALTEDRAIAALDGNLCRCTGYQSLKKTARQIFTALPERQEDRPVPWLVENGYLPSYFIGMPEKLALLPPPEPVDGPVTVAGGTDLLVQKPDTLRANGIQLFQGGHEWGGILVDGERCRIGAEVTTTQLLRDPALKAAFPRLEEYGRLIASTPIRNMGTLGGNLANASPIADLAIFFLALDTTILLKGPAHVRELPLERFFTGYKQLDLRPEEHIAAIRTRLPGPGDYFHFEKVSKRKHLDIASVNSAISLQIERGTIRRARLSAGGVSPVPLFLEKTSAFLEGRPANAETLRGAQAVVQEEIRPISDIRGSEEYKRTLLRQLLQAHFLELKLI